MMVFASGCRDLKQSKTVRGGSDVYLGEWRTLPDSRVQGPRHSDMPFQRCFAYPWLEKSENWVK